MNDMKTFVLTKLKQAGVNLRVVANETGVPYPSLLKINQGRIKNPGIDHMQALYNYFSK